MELLLLLALMLDGPFRWALILAPLPAIAVPAFGIGFAVGRRAGTGYIVPARWIGVALAVTIVSGLAMTMLQPLRSPQQTLLASQLGRIDSAAAHAEIDRNNSIRGLTLRGATHFGPFVFVLAAACGLRAASACRPEKSREA